MFIDRYTSDAMLMAPNMPAMSGTAGIAGFYKAALTQMGVKGISLTTTNVYGEGDYATEEGSYELFAAGGKAIDKGKFLVVWKKPMQAGKCTATVLTVIIHLRQPANKFIYRYLKKGTPGFLFLLLCESVLQVCDARDDELCTFAGYKNKSCINIPSTRQYRFYLSCRTGTLMSGLTRRSPLYNNRE